jgi:hypothetical protein
MCGKATPTLGEGYEDLDLLRELFDRFMDRDALMVLVKFSGGLSGYACCDLVVNASPRNNQDANFTRLSYWSCLVAMANLTTRTPHPNIRYLFSTR